MTVGDRIKALRLQNGLTQKELADKCGYKSLTTINKIELNINSVPMSTVEKIADVFGVSPAYLMGWKEDDATLPENPTLTGMKAEIVELVATMPEDKQKLLLELIKSMKNGR